MPGSTAHRSSSRRKPTTKGGNRSSAGGVRPGGAGRSLRCGHQARQILRKLVTGRLIFVPKADAQGHYYEFAGHGTLGQVVAGAFQARAMVTPAGPDRFRLTVPLHHLPAGGVKALLHRDRQRIVHGLAPAWILEASSLWSFVAVRVPLGTFIHNGIVPDLRGLDHRLQRGLSSRPLRPRAGSRPRAPGGCPATPSRHRQDRLRTDRAPQALWL